MDKEKLRVVISGGGTGGHLYPALAIANEIRSRYPQARILFVGAKGKIEMKKVPKAGFSIIGLWISGLQRRLTLDNLSFPFKVIHSLLKSRQILKLFKPDIVIGTGGFASGPVLKMANMMGIKTVIQEQNSFPGITNKLLAKDVSKIFVAYDGLEKFFDSKKMIKTGNPVRSGLSDLDSIKDEAKDYFGLDQTKKTLLIIGGSLGAKRINELVAENLQFFLQENWQILWQCGKLYYKQYSVYNQHGVVVKKFIDKMDYAYASADLIISRAGASTISELTLVGKPVIFIPSPNVAEDHQSKNAQSMVSNNAGVMIKEKDLDGFKEFFKQVSSDQESLDNLGRNLKTCALPDATRQIVDNIIELID